MNMLCEPLYGAIKVLCNIRIFPDHINLFVLVWLNDMQSKRIALSRLTRI